MSKHNILVTGANGQLGLEFQKINNRDLQLHFLAKKELDITDVDSINTVVKAIKPDVIINCAAYTAVDAAEENISQAFLINDSAVAHLGEIAKEIDCKVIHISTDYVYHLDQEVPLSEQDDCKPQSIYGKSKRAGELSLVSQTDDFLIFRVSWLYSAQKNNFVKTMLRLGKSRDQLYIVNDQIGAPTSAADLVKDILHIVNNHLGATGIYNYSNAGVTNWSQFAKEIFDQTDIKCDIKGISTEDYGAAAPRPLWSVMSTNKIQQDFDLIIPSWQQSLTECLEELKAIP